MHAEATPDQQELPPETVEFIKNIAVTSAFQSDATPDMIASVARIEPHTSDHEALASYLATTTSGLDLVITEMPRSKYWRPDDATFNKATDWRTGSAILGPLSDGYYLEGLLEQKYRTLDLEEGRFEIQLMTGPDRVNDMMTALGRQPGVDCFKLVPVEGGKFSAQSLVEAVARFQIPMAIGEGLYIEHDRTLDDHVQTWWSMPSELVTYLQQRASEVLKTNDPEAIKSFADGIDLMSSLSTGIIPEVSRVLDGEWAESETAEDRLRELRDSIFTLADHVGANGASELGIKHDANTRYHANAACVALIETDLLPDISLSEPDKLYGIRSPIFPGDGTIVQNSSEVMRARQTVVYWGTAYARTAADMLTRASQIQNLPTTDRRDELMRRIAEELTVSLPAAA